MAANIDVSCITEFVGDACINAGNASMCAVVVMVVVVVVVVVVVLVVVVARKCRRALMSKLSSSSPHCVRIQMYTSVHFPRTLFHQNRSQ